MKETDRDKRDSHFSQANTINDIKEDKYNVGDMDILNACSTMDCTGLMFRPPRNEDETDSYHEVYSFGPPEVDLKAK
jgi:hypothetical protein